MVNIFLLNATRFKLCRQKNGNAPIPIPPELHGRWVALVAADDDRHLNTYYVLKNYDSIQETCTSLLDELRKLRTEYDEEARSHDIEENELKEKRNRLANFLVKYARHEELCEAVLAKELVLPCTCGLDAALKEAGK